MGPFVRLGNFSGRWGGGRLRAGSCRGDDAVRSSVAHATCMSRRQSRLLGGGLCGGPLPLGLLDGDELLQRGVAGRAKGFLVACGKGPSIAAQALETASDSAGSGRLLPRELARDPAREASDAALLPPSLSLSLVAWAISA